METDSAMNDAGMPTPPASSAAPSTITSPLPRPRRHPLKPASTKESDLIRYLDHGLNNVQLRVDNRQQEAQAGQVAGYKHFAEIERDVESLVDVVWVSGSPNLQIPYLLNIARLISEILPLFPPSPRATFRLLDKLDLAFSSLLSGKDAETGEPLPGFENGRTVDITSKVRLKGIVDRTRLVVVRRLSEGVVDGEGEGMVDEEEDGRGGESGVEDSKGDTVHFEGFEDNDDIDMDGNDGEEVWEEKMIGKVYEKTIGTLGDELSGDPIGIVTE